jgi:hypothetical protein
MRGEETTMKFFTPELYERTRSTDEVALGAAEDEWEAALACYEQHLQAIEPRMPEHIRSFNALLLHDAVVQSVARQGDQLLLILRQDVPPRDLVILSYELIGESVLEPFVHDPRDWSTPAKFNFDEFDVVNEGDRPLYTQEIVFGNGWLLRLRFRDVQVTLAHPLYLAAQPSPALVGAPFAPSSV